MKRIKWLSIVLIAMCFCGCASTPNPWTDEYVAGIEVAKENAVKLATISEFKTCFIRTVLGTDINQLPHKMVITLGEIDELLEEIGDDHTRMTDCQKGQILALWTRLVTLGVLEIVEEINPGILGKLL